MSKLFWLQPDNSIVEFPLKAEQSLIGRSSRCDVRIKHPGISSEHAVIRQLPGSATVEDLGSTNGTRINGKRIENVHPLRHGDQIGVGRERLMYFAELDEAAHFLQPESIQPFASPAPGGERVNTAEPGAISARSEPAPILDLAIPPFPVASPVPVATPKPPPPSSKSALLNEPLLDISLIAALPKGASLATAPPVPAQATSHAAARNPEPQPAAKVSLKAATSTPATITSKPQTPVPSSTATSPAAPRVGQSLNGSVAVLSGPAAGKRYPLNQASVTLGKEGKQVVEFLRAGSTRWQIRQREGVTPAYINGDALAGLRDLAAGDVIELTGVRLRFEIALATD
jgi:predicted component of type VI protein secretion system